MNHHPLWYRKATAAATEAEAASASKATATMAATPPPPGPSQQPSSPRPRDPNGYAPGVGIRRYPAYEAYEATSAASTITWGSPPSPLTANNIRILDAENRALPKPQSVFERYGLDRALRPSPASASSRQEEDFDTRELESLCSYDDYLVDSEDGTESICVVEKVEDEEKGGNEEQDADQEGEGLRITSCFSPTLTNTNVVSQIAEQLRREHPSPDNMAVVEIFETLGQQATQRPSLMQRIQRIFNAIKPALACLLIGCSS